MYVPSAHVTHLRHDTTQSILDTYWRWRPYVNPYAYGARLRSVLGRAIFVHFRYTFLDPFRKDVEAHRWKLAALDFLVLAYFLYRDFCLWLSTKTGSSR